jgi:hypothetical protein
MKILIDIPEVTYKQVCWRGLSLCPRDSDALVSSIRKGTVLQTDFDAHTYNLTELGRQRLDLISKYNLEPYFQPQTGNVIIPNEEFKEPITRYVMIFLKDNLCNKWVLGHEEDYWFLTTLSDIKEI